MSDTPRPKNAHWSDALRPLSPCGEAMDYLRTQPDAEALAKWLREFGSEEEAK